MEKLNKVIAGLECCGEDDRCLSCPYKDVGHPNDLDCLKMLAKDALEKLRWMDTMKGARLELARRCRELEEENERLRRKLKYARTERDLAREKLARITGEREAAWLSGSQTNYQKIKNMGPLHMVEWILKTVHPCECCDKQGVCGIPEDEVNDEYCAEHILLWLMQEVEK